MNIQFLSEPKFKEPVLIAAWPGMGYLAKISADYLRRRLKAEKFAEIVYPQNSIIYKDGLAELPNLSHRFYAAPDNDLIICVGDAQPSTPEETLNLADDVLELAEKYNVKRIYTMAAYPCDYTEEPTVYGIFTDEGLKEEMVANGVDLLEGEGSVNGLNGILIGIAKNRGIKGICLMGEIRYANVPQHLSAKAVLERLTSMMGIEIDTSQLVKRAARIDASIRKSLKDYEQEEDRLKQEEKKYRYIS